MKLGIWCDFNFTLAPSEGIGVFVDNLVRGLLEADNALEIVLKCNHRDWQIASPLVDYGGGRVQVDCSWQPTSLERSLTRWARKLRRVMSTDSTPVKQSRWSVRSLCSHPANFFSQRSHKKHRETILSCDAWIVPYVGLDMVFERPNIVIVHDLVCHHFPEMMKACKLNELMTTARHLVDQATLVACMSNFIRNNDIKGVLGVSDDRIRVVKPAVPQDLVNIDSAKLDESGVEIDKRLDGKRYLFYPSAFRSYKNHELLLKTLKELQDRGESDWQVAFTGIRSCPPSLAELAKELGVEGRVVCLGKVSREELYALYKKAFATVVPSRYEQGSFPIMEALAVGCPAISSDIPSMREQFESLGNAMLYADPDSVGEVLAGIDQIRFSREEIIRSQSQGFQAIKQFTWRQAASQWLDAVRESIAKDSSASEVRVVAPDLQIYDHRLREAA